MQIQNFNTYFKEEQLNIEFELVGGGEFSTDCGIVCSGIEATISSWNYNQEADIAFIKAHFIAPIIQSTMTVLCSNGQIEYTLPRAVPDLFYTDDDYDFTRNANSRKIWKMLGDFWRLFDDTKVVENIWGGYLVAIQEIYRLVEYIGKSKYINEIDPAWLSNFMLLGPVDKLVRVDTTTGFDQKLEVGTWVLDIPVLFKFSYRYTDNQNLDGVDAYVNANDYVLHTKDEFLHDIELINGRDFIVKDGCVYFRSDLSLKGNYWAPWIKTESDAINRQFGFAFDSRDTSSEEYLEKIKALWIAMWRGPTEEAILDGLSMLLQAPYAKRECIIYEITKDADKNLILLDNGEIIETEFNPIVKVGQKVNKFQPFTDACKVIDRVNDYDWFYAAIDKSSFSNKDLSEVTSLDTWMSATDKYKHLRYHKFRAVIRVKEKGITPKDIQFARLFLNNIKPSHTQFDIEVGLENQDTLDKLADYSKTEIRLIASEELWADPCLGSSNRVSKFKNYNFSNSGVTL